MASTKNTQAQPAEVQDTRKAPQTAAAKKEEQAIAKWLAEGQQIAENAKGNAFRVGDWWAAGEVYSHRPEATELFAGLYTRRTLQQLGYVAKNVKPSVRTDELSFMHHQLVASLPEDQQKEWLNRAVDEGLTVAAMRGAIKGQRSPSGTEGGLELDSGEEPEASDEFNQHRYLGEIKHLLMPKKTSRLDEAGRAELATMLDRVCGRLSR